MAEFYTSRIAFQMTPVLESNSTFGLFDWSGLSGLAVLLGTRAKLIAYVGRV